MNRESLNTSELSCGSRQGLLGCWREKGDGCCAARSQSAPARLCGATGCGGSAMGCASILPCHKVPPVPTGMTPDSCCGFQQDPMLTMGLFVSVSLPGLCQLGFNAGHFCIVNSCHNSQKYRVEHESIMKIGLK